MAYLANDKTPFTNRPMMVRHNSKLAAAKLSSDKSDNMDSDMSEDQNNDQDKQDITDNPKAMKLVGQLEAMGYTAEDFEKACSDHDESEESNDSGDVHSVDKSGSMQLPNLG